MKLVINYDLIDKINEAKGEFTLQRAMKDRIPWTSCWSCVYIGLNLITGDSFDKAISDVALTASAVFTTSVALDVLIYKRFGDIKRKAAIKKISKLSTDLCKLNVETSFDLLLEAEEDREHRKHILDLNEKNIPFLMQNKYIMVPTYDNGKIKETSLLQEHLIGSKEYVLSIGSPTKSKVFRPAHTNI